jgi:anti-sigma regulatory factor (Ser/Thr protein kinase)
VGPDSDDSVVLVFPAEADALSLVRLFIAAVGRHLGLSFEVVEDLKLALTELCAEAIEDASSSQPVITIEVRSMVRAAPVCTVKSSTGRQFHPQGGDVGDQRRRLLKAMLPGLELTKDPSGVRFPVSGVS